MQDLLDKIRMKRKMMDRERQNSTIIEDTHEAGMKEIKIIRPTQSKARFKRNACLGKKLTGRNRRFGHYDRRNLGETPTNIESIQQQDMREMTQDVIQKIMTGKI